jgi:hypothetical protein
MSHWAEIDENNIVVRVVVGDNNDPNGDEGYQWLIDNLGGRWIKASYNATIRKNFPGAGFIFREDLNSPEGAFIISKPFESWTLNKETCQWNAPVEYPNDGNLYSWNESTISWEDRNLI